MKKVKTKASQEHFLCGYCGRKVSRISDTSEFFIEETNDYDAENFCSGTCEIYSYVGRP